MNFFVKALVSRTSYNQTRGYAETKNTYQLSAMAKTGLLLVAQLLLSIIC